MSIDLAATHDYITHELAESQGIGDTMRRVLARCQDFSPHPDWKELARLPYEDISGLQEWLRQVFEQDPPEHPLAGLWFGLFNPVYGEEVVADIYICGSTRFNPNPYSKDWAVRPAWWPEGRYAYSEILADIYRIAYREEDGLGNDAEYPLCLAYGAALVRELLNSPEAQAFQAYCGTPGVAVGFDSGDFILLGRFTEQGLVDFE